MYKNFDILSVLRNMKFETLRLHSNPGLRCLRHPLQTPRPGDTLLDQQNAVDAYNTHQNEISTEFDLRL